MRTDFAIETYDTTRVENPDPSGEIDFGRWMKVRNTIVRACKRHGSTGPLGIFNFNRPVDHRKDIFDAWESGDDPCTFFIPTDQTNDTDRYQYVEVHSSDAFSKQWLSDIMDALLTHRGWGVGVMNIEGGYMLIFANKIMVTGSIAAASGNVDEVVREARANLAIYKGEGG